MENGTDASTKKPVKVMTKHQNRMKTNHSLKQDEVIEISLNRVRHAHRAERIMCDNASQNFAILQTNPSFG